MDSEYKLKKTENWNFTSQEELLKLLTDLIQAKKISGAVIYVLFLAVGLLAIFDTQVLSIFRRQKEIGTYIALGMTRWQVVRIFTFEGAMYSLFAVLLAVVFGAPLLWMIAKTGIPMPKGSTDMGIIISDVIYPVYSVSLIIRSIVLIVFFATFVSFIPARKIARMNPILALKEKVKFYWGMSLPGS